MKKGLFSLALALAVCAVLVIPASATNVTEEKWQRFGQQETGLSLYTEQKTIISKHGGSGPHGSYIPGIPSSAWDKGLPVAITCYGLKDADGNIVLPADYSSLEYLGTERLLVAGKDLLEEGYAVIDLHGKLVIPYGKYEIEAKGIDGTGDAVLLIHTGAWNTAGDYNTALYNWNGNALLKWGEYSSIQYLGNRYFQLIKKDNKMRGIYEYGVGIVMSPQGSYRSIRWFDGYDLFQVENQQGLVGVINKTGAQILPCIYEYVSTGGYSQGCFVVSRFTDESSKADFQRSGMLTEIDADRMEDALIDGRGTYLIPFGQYDSISVSNDGNGRAGMWTGQYKYNLGGSSGSSNSFGKIYNYTYSFKIQDLLAENGGIPADIGSSSNPPQIITPPSAFFDVPSGSYFAEPVKWAVSKGITTGTSGTKFSPEEKCTHIQILTFLYRAVEQIKAPNAADMEKAVAWAQEKGMLAPDFNRSKSCTRSEAVYYIWQAMGRQDAPASSFTDVPAGSSYSKAVDWAVVNEVTNGTSATTFSPNDTCTRGQIVTFLYRAMG